NTLIFYTLFFFFSSRRRHTRSKRDWSSDVCSSDLIAGHADPQADQRGRRFDAPRVPARLHAPATQGERAGRGGLREGAPARSDRSEERRVGKEESGRGWRG